MQKIRPIAIHLPQFHPIPENNEWWGKGFTEWTNVAKATPLFEGHEQPHLPADLGFYDLRLEEARIAQEILAKQYGLYGFCYYHYWFNGKRLLYEPLDRKLKNPKEDFPFMICWANENWTRRWDGWDSEVLIKQEYSHQDDLDHIRFLCKHYFADSRYIRVNGKPFFAFYRINLFPDIKKTIQIWREEAQKMGIGELYLGYMTSFEQVYDLKEYDLDVAIEFAPHFSRPLRKFTLHENQTFNKIKAYKKRIFQILRIKALIELNAKLDKKLTERPHSPFFKNYVFDYKAMVEKEGNRPIAEKTYPSLFPMWDNSARKKGRDAHIFINNSPEFYKTWLQAILKKFKPFSPEENFIFINAWNEWAEGNHLEPCKKWGLQYLEATKAAFDTINAN
jgi:lipopolysaccharide biosynthesis protein